MNLNLTILIILVCVSTLQCKSQTKNNSGASTCAVHEQNFTVNEDLLGSLSSEYLDFLKSTANVDILLIHIFSGYNAANYNNIIRCMSSDSLSYSVLTLKNGKKNFEFYNLTSSFISYINS